MSKLNTEIPLKESTQGINMSSILDDVTVWKSESDILIFKRLEDSTKVIAIFVNSNKGRLLEENEIEKLIANKKIEQVKNAKLVEAVSQTESEPSITSSLETEATLDTGNTL